MGGTIKTDNKKPLLSIIIPIYNAEKSLSRCLESILAQNYENWEAILIDDGSTDNSGAICDEYATRYTQFKVLHQKNSGASCARNKGIEHSKGDWITFIDADDYVENNYLAKLKDGILEVHSLTIQGLNFLKDGIIFKKESFKNEKFEKKNFNIIFGEKKVFEHGHTVAKLYNTEIVKEHNIRFKKDISYSEDLIFMLEYILHCNSIHFIDGANYNYITDSSILSQRYNSFEEEFNVFNTFEVLTNKIYHKFSFNATKEILQYSALILMRSIFSLYKNNIYSRKERLACIKIVKQRYHNFIFNHYNPQIPLMKALKRIFFLNNSLFDIACKIKL